MASSGAGYLSSLAICAAIEIDNLLIKEAPYELKSLGDLIKELKESITPIEVQNQKRFLDPTTVIVMSNAIQHSFQTPESGKLENIHQLVERSGEIIANLQELSSQTGEITANKENVAKLRDFCLFLSQQASAYEKPFYDPHA
jgi:hypothetical protein